MPRLPLTTSRVVVLVVCVAVVAVALLGWRRLRPQPLHEAVREGDLSDVRWALRCGADVDEADEAGLTPLMWAAWLGDVTLADEFIACGANLDAVDAEGETALMKAAFQGRTAVAKSLLDAQASVDSQDNSGETALILAATKGHHSVVRVLLGRGADARMATNEGLTPLMLAAGNGHATVVPLVLSQGDVDAVDSNGETALMKAATMGQLATLRQLLAAGADVRRANANDQGLMTLAAAGGNEAVSEELRAAGAQETGPYWLWRGYSLARQSRPTDALDNLRKAAQAASDANRPWRFSVAGWQYDVPWPAFLSWLLIGDCYQRMGQLDDASQAFRTALETSHAPALPVIYHRSRRSQTEQETAMYSLDAASIESHVAGPQSPWELRVSVQLHRSSPNAEYREKRWQSGVRGLIQ